MLERATCNVAATVFTANLRDLAIATARSVFCPCEVESRLEGLDLHGLATQKTFELADAVLELAGFRSRNDVLVALPTEQQLLPS
jgi:hypothetical protein